MTLHLPSILLGVLLTYAFSVVLVGVLVFVNNRVRARKERDRALDKLLADVAIKCVETPADVRVN